MSDYKKYNGGSLGKKIVRFVTRSIPAIPLGAIVFSRLMRRKEKTHYLVFTPALGDAMMDLSYLAEFKRQRGFSHVTVVCTGYTKRVCAYFPDAVDNVLPHKKWELRALYSFYHSVIGQYCFGANLDRITVCTIRRPELWDNSVIDYPMYVKVMQYKISLSSQPQRPHVPQTDISKYVDQYGLVKKKTVFLNPAASTVRCDITALLAATAAKLTVQGYKVVTLTANREEQPVQGTQALPCTLEEAYYLVGFGGTLIGLRSGFMDLMVYAECKIVSIDDEDYGFKWVFDLEKFGVNPDCHTVVYNGDNKAALHAITRLFET